MTNIPLEDECHCTRDLLALIRTPHFYFQRLHSGDRTPCYELLLPLGNRLPLSAMQVMKRVKSDLDQVVMSKQVSLKGGPE